MHTGHKCPALLTYSCCQLWHNAQMTHETVSVWDAIGQRARWTSIPQLSALLVVPKHDICSRRLGHLLILEGVKCWDARVALHTDSRRVFNGVIAASPTNSGTNLEQGAGGAGCCRSTTHRSASVQLSPETAPGSRRRSPPLEASSACAETPNCLRLCRCQRRQHRACPRQLQMLGWLAQ